MSTHLPQRDRLGVGFVGAGPVVQAIHLPTLARLGDRFSVAHIMDIDGSHAQQVASPWGARSSTKLQELLDDESVDVVAICSPAALHAKQALAAIHAGKQAVLVEKPYATDGDQGRLIGNAAREAGTVVMVGAMHLYDPGWTQVAAERQRLRVTTRHIRSSIVLPPNPVFEDAATEVIRPGNAPVTGDQNAAERIRMLLLGLTIHDLPLIRRQLPSQGSSASLQGLEVLRAELCPPAGYLVHVRIDGILLELHSQLSIPGEPEWTLTLTSPETVLTTDFTPSYVQAGSASTTIYHEGRSATVPSQSQNGYEMEWVALADGVSGLVQPPDLAEHDADLAFALMIAERVADHLGVTKNVEVTA